MAPVITPRVPPSQNIRQIARSLTSSISSLTVRDVSSSGASLASVFALIVGPRTSLSRRALSSLTELPTQHTTIRSLDPLSHAPLLFKRQNQNVILAIPTTYQGLNSGPSPGAVVGITLGAVGGFLLCLYILLLTLQFVGGPSTTVVKEEVTIKRRSHSKSKSRKSSHHSAIPVPVSVHEPSPPPPRSRRETIVEIEEEIIEHHHHSPSPEPEEVIVEEEETVSDEIVEVIEEHSPSPSGSPSSSSIVSPSPPPRKPSSSRRSGFRIVDPAEPGGGDRPMRRMSRRSSGRE